MTWLHYLIVGIALGGSGVAYAVARQTLGFAAEIHEDAIKRYAAAVKREQRAEWAEARAKEFVE